MTEFRGQPQALVRALPQAPPLPPKPPVPEEGACQSCGHQISNRNRRYFMMFRDKPLCARWKACYKRRTGKTFYQSRRYRRTGLFVR